MPYSAQMRENWRPWAITGGIAEGKSTVLNYLAEAGWRTASADLVAREVFERAETQEFLSARLGTADRVAIRQRLSEPHVRRLLNGYMHGPVWAALVETEADVVEVPLLIETVLHPRCAGVWVVTCGVDEQRRRLIQRLGDPREVDRLLATQLSSQIKRVFADRVIDSNLPEPHVRREVLGAAKQDFRQQIA